MFNKFKLFGMVALLAAALLMVSCSKEDKIVGKWKITHASGEFSDCKGDIWTFKDNGKCSGVVVFEDELDFEWSLSNDCLTLEIDEDGASIVGEFDIDELSSSEMSLSGEWKYSYYEYDYEYGGRNLVSGKYKVNYDFEKK